MSKSIIAAVCCLAFALATGCNKQDGSGGGTKKTTIAVIPKGTTHEFWKSVHNGAEKAGKELDVKIIWKGPLTEDDAKSQIELVEQFISDGVTGIVLAPLDANSLQRPAAEAMGKKIPVVIFDSALNGKAGDDFVSLVATDNRKGGQLAGEELARLLGGKGKVVLLRYKVGSASTDEREKGFLEVMARNPGITLIEKDRYGGATVGEAQKVSENMIDKLRDADGIFCPNESSTIGMLNVLRANNLIGKKKFVGFDATGPLVTALKAGELQAVVAQDPTGMGYKAVQTMVKHLKGEKVDTYVDTGCALVTKEKMSDPKIKALIGE